jgi:hypothetical protein
MIFKTPSQLDFLTNPCSSAAVVQSGVSMRRHNTPPRKLAGMPASSQCLTSPVTGCTKTAPPSPGPGSGTLGTQPEESVATRASKRRKTTVMSLPAERDPGLAVFMRRLLSGQANDRARFFRASHGGPRYPGGDICARSRNRPRATRPGANSMLLNSRVPGAGVRVSARVPACDPRTRTALRGMPRRAPHARDGHPRRES